MKICTFVDPIDRNNKISDTYAHTYTHEHPNTHGTEKNYVKCRFLLLLHYLWVSADVWIIDPRYFYYYNALVRLF